MCSYGDGQGASWACGGGMQHKQAHVGQPQHLERGLSAPRVHVLAMGEQSKVGIQAAPPRTGSCPTAPPLTSRQASCMACACARLAACSQAVLPTAYCWKQSAPASTAWWTCTAARQGAALGHTAGPCKHALACRASSARQATEDDGTTTVTAAAAAVADAHPKNMHSGRPPVSDMALMLITFAICR